MKLDFSKVDMVGTPKESPVTQYNAIDIESAKKSFLVYKDKIDNAVSKIMAFKVDCDRKEKELVEMLATCAGLVKAVEKFRKGRIYDADKFVRGFNSFVKSFRDPLEAGITAGKQKVGAYQYKKELKRRETEAKAQKEAARLQAEMDARAKKAGIAPVTMPAMIQPTKRGPVRTESGTVSTRMEWTWEAEGNVMDVLSRDYLMPDKKVIDAAVKAGIRKIDGIRIFEQPKVSIRT